MKLINLNVWGGRVHEPLMDLIEKTKDTVDIYCFQEVFDSPKSVITNENYSDTLRQLAKLLDNYDYYFHPMVSGWDTNGPVDFPLSFGQAIFYKKEFKLLDKGYEFVYNRENEIGRVAKDGRGIFPRNFIYVKLEKNGKSFLVINLHGFWEPAPKYDTPQRFVQSQKILDFFEKQNLPIILAGDFNISINTRSILLLEDKLKNLVKEYKLKTTRSSLYNPFYRINDKFADYIFTSNDMEIKKFEALEETVSDHLPLYLEFEV